MLAALRVNARRARGVAALGVTAESDLQLADLRIRGAPSVQLIIVLEPVVDPTSCSIRDCSDAGAADQLFELLERLLIVRLKVHDP